MSKTGNFYLFLCTPFSTFHRIKTRIKDLRHASLDKHVDALAQQILTGKWIFIFPVFYYNTNFNYYIKSYMKRYVKLPI